jgi:hypothetical protein
LWCVESDDDIAFKKFFCSIWLSVANCACLLDLQVRSFNPCIHVYSFNKIHFAHTVLNGKFISHHISFMFSEGQYGEASEPQLYGNLY